MTEAGTTPTKPVHNSRLSQLSQACLSINENLEFDTVLRVILDSARTLTDARYGLLTLVDGHGAVEEYLTSGLDPADARRLSEMPGAPSFYEHLTNMARPLRVNSLQDYLRDRGFTGMCFPVPVTAFLAAPMHHAGQGAGFICLARDDGAPRFTQEDLESLGLFAAHGALVIANARRQREERRARADLETLLETSPVGVAVFDARRGALKSLNREARRIVGERLAPDKSDEELLGMLSFRRADGQVVSMQELTLTQALSSGEVVRAEEVVVMLPDGRSVSTLVNATPILSDEGEVESLIVTVQDLAPLEETVRLRAEFLGMVSHELRTPLTSIRGSATTLLDDGASLAPAEIRQFYRIIVDQADRMRSLISDLLDVANIETGTLSIAPEPSDLADLVDEARIIFQRVVGREQLEIDLETELPRVMADRQRIVQVLGNLLSNAARYSSESSPIGVRARLQGQNVEVVVWDCGKGISAEQMPQLFQKFARLENMRQGQDMTGSGLGLAICKGIVEAHGGRINAESEGANLGAQFTFTLPAVDSAGSNAVSTSRSSRSGRGRTRVLAVDDDPMSLRHIRDALAQSDYHPVVTTDPAEVMGLIESERPHLVLLDLMLPGTSGVDLMQSILSATDLPIIFVSAYGQEENVTRVLDMGAVDYVVKPFAAAELGARIRAALRQRAGLNRGSKPPPYVLGDLVINYADRAVTLDGEPVELTATEYAVLSELSAHGGMVLTHDQLLEQVWGIAHSGEAGLVRTIIRRLRRKLGDEARNPRYILTQPRVGYRMRRGERPAADELLS